MVVESSPAPPKHGPVLQYFNNNKPSKNDKTAHLLDRQIPNDLVYDLAGRMKLITRDKLTDKYNTFMVYRDEHNIPYIQDPTTGGKYVLKHSNVKKGLYIYKMTQHVSGKPAVYNWAKDRVDEIRVNEFGEVNLVPIDDTDTEEERTKVFSDYKNYYVQ